MDKTNLGEDSIEDEPIIYKPVYPPLLVRDSSTLLNYNGVLSPESESRMHKNLEKIDINSANKRKRRKKRNLKDIVNQNKVAANSNDQSTTLKEMSNGAVETEDKNSPLNLDYLTPKRKLPPLDTPTTAFAATSAIGMSAAIPETHENNKAQVPNKLPPLEHKGVNNLSYEEEGKEEAEKLNKDVETNGDINRTFYKRPKATLFFKDGVRRIDYVLAYTDPLEERSKIKDIRDRFEAALEFAGLQLESEPKEASQDENTCFVKIHVPWETLLKYGERMRMKLPLKEDKPETIEENETVAQNCIHKLKDIGNFICLPFTLKNSSEDHPSNYYTAEFSRDKLQFFDIKDKETFFSNSERSRIAYRILCETRYGQEEDRLALGIQKLINEGIYESAFPLHEGKHCGEPDKKLPKNHNERRHLYWDWARWGRWYKYQPLHRIRLYFGEKIGMYFAFLGFYTMMLLNASIVGLIVLLYGIITLFDADDNIRFYLGDKVALYFAWLGFYTKLLLLPSVVGLGVFIYSLVSTKPIVSEACDPSYPTYAGNLTMCPLCDVDCPFWKLKSSCLATQITHLFDNEATIFFAVFMSLWATMFLEFWKRRQFRLAYEWDLVDYDEERDLIRPEFEAQVRNMRFNPVTQQKEPYLRTKERFSRTAFSLLTVLFWIVVIVAAVFAIIIYRLAITAVFVVTIDFSDLQDVSVVGQFATPQMLTTITASCLSLIVIMLLNKVYEKVAIWLTNLVILKHKRIRADIQWIQMSRYTFSSIEPSTKYQQFVNYYSYLFYIAFFKQTFAGYPGDYTYFAGRWRWEQCDAGGCMYELSIQLFIIMFGKQTWNNVVEIVMPWLLNKIKRWRRKEKPDNEYTRWEQDYDLQEVDHFSLFYEYLEMVIQFGFVTLFVAAFPLAPLLALINNIIEIRLDANKFICELRRPLSQKCADIGAWYYLLEFIASLSVVTNSFTIALTSDAIPKMVYYYEYSLMENGGNYTESTNNGFTENSLSYFNVSDFSSRSMPTLLDPFGEGNVTVCRYRDYRSPPWEDPKYKLTMQYWHIIAGRLAFVIVMEHVVFLLKALLDYIIPDRPEKLKREIKREHFLVKSMLIKAETEHRIRQAVEEKESEFATKLSQRKPVAVMSSSFDVIDDKDAQVIQTSPGKAPDDLGKSPV